MSHLPLTMAVPAAAAAAAYFNARAAIGHDFNLLVSVLPAALGAVWRQWRGRLNLFSILEDLALSSSAANRVFLRVEDRTWTYAQVYDVTLRHAALLASRFGVRTGQIVMLDFANGEHMVFMLLSLWALGARPALLNYNLTGKPLVHCVKKADSRIVFVEPAVAEMVTAEVKAQLGRVEFVIFTPLLEAEALRTEPVRPPDDVRANSTIDDMAVLIYTSGTTGLPKAAILSWGKLVIVGDFTARWIGTKPGDVFYTSMPLYHGTAIVMGFSHALCRGATLALGRKFSASQFWPDVRRHDATIIQYVGEACRYLLTAPPQIDPQTGENLDRKHRVRVAFGNGMRPEVWTRFKTRFGIEAVAEFYAATEGSFGLWNLSFNDFGAGAIGRNGWLYELVIGRNLAVVVVDFERNEPLRDQWTGFCTRVKPGDPGELMFRLPPGNIKSRFQGYYGDEAATNDKICRNVLFEGDVWFRTGDVVRKDADGRTFFLDRIGDTFRWKSENVSTAEVAEIMGSHPSVRHLNVYGVQVPHHEGRAGCAAVVLENSALSGSADNGDALPRKEVLESLARHVRRGLPKYALPLFLRVVQGNCLEMTGTNKQPKNALREQGVAPETTAPDKMYLLRGDSYVRFSAVEWETLAKGRLRL